MLYVVTYMCTIVGVYSRAVDANQCVRALRRVGCIGGRVRRALRSPSSYPLAAAPWWALASTDVFSFLCCVCAATGTSTWLRRAAQQIPLSLPLAPCDPCSNHPKMQSGRRIRAPRPHPAAPGDEFCMHSRLSHSETWALILHFSEF